MKSSLLNEKAQQLQWEIEQQHLVSGRIESARRETEQIFNVAVPICVIDKEFCVHQVNDAFCELFDCIKSDVIGAPCRSIWKCDLCDTERCPLQNVLSTGKPYTTEGLFYTHGGRKRICDVAAKPFYHAEDNLAGIVENLIDTTVRREMEGQLERNRVLLEEQNHLLFGKNMALRELMEQIRLEKKQTEAQIVDNVEHMVRPLIEKLKACYYGKESIFIEMIETNINDLTSSFASTLTQKNQKLSPREITVCNMIKNGLDSKGIARLLNLSIKTVETHRKNIRKKLGITKNHENLYACLTSIC